MYALPTLQALQSKGLHFSQAFTCSPESSPARASLMTGLDVAAHGLWTDGVALPKRETPLPEVFAQNGYVSWLVGRRQLAGVSNWTTEHARPQEYLHFDWAHGPLHRSRQNAYLHWLQQTEPEAYTSIFPQQANPDDTTIASAQHQAMAALPDRLSFNAWIGKQVCARLGGDTPFFGVVGFVVGKTMGGTPALLEELDPKALRQADAGYDCGMIGKQHLAPCDTWRTEPRQDDGYRVFEWAHGPNHRALENDYHRWLRRTHPDLYQGIFPDKGANENTEYSNRARTGTPIDHVPKEAHYSHWVAERAIDFIDHDRKEPFFLMANFFDPHHSFGAPQEFRNMIDANAIPAPNTKAGELDEKPKDHRAYSKKSYGGTSPGFQDYTAAEIKEIRAQYWAMIALIDYEVGRILTALEDAGHGQNTLVVFTSDHGEMLGNHQQLLKGPQLYDDLCRVPLIARWPAKITAGTSLANPVQWIDLTATILDASDCAPGAGVQGQSLVPMLTGHDVEFRPWALCEYRDSGFPTEPPVMTTMLRYEHWKLIVWHGAPACGNDRDGELYDLDADPDELHNLFHDPAQAKLRKLMKERMLAAMVDAEDLTQIQARPW